MVGAESVWKQRAQEHQRIIYCVFYFFFFVINVFFYFFVEKPRVARALPSAHEESNNLMMEQISPPLNWTRFFDCFKTTPRRNRSASFIHSYRCVNRRREKPNRPPTAWYVLSPSVKWNAQRTLDTPCQIGSPSLFTSKRVPEIWSRWNWGSLLLFSFRLGLRTDNISQ